MSSADSALIVRLAEIALAWLIVVGAIWLFRIAHRRLDQRLLEWRKSLWKLHSQSKQDKGVQLKIAFATRLRAALTVFYRLALFVLSFLMISAAVTFTLSRFPATEALADTWIDWIKDPILGILNAVVEYLPNLGFLIVWIFVIYWLIRILKGLARWVDAGILTIPGFHSDWAEPTYRVLAFLMIAFALVVAFPYLPGGKSPAFQGVSIFIGVLVSLGSGSAMGNVISGIILTYTRAFRISDYVKIGEHVGSVMGRSMFVTRIRTIKNEEVFIPNGQVIAGAIVNYSEGKNAGGFILNTTITIGYDAPWRKVHQLMIDAALRTEGVLPDPKPFVFQTALNDYNVSYQINAYTNQPQDMAIIYSDLHRNLQETFNEGGVEIMSPAYHSMRDGNHTTIPTSYLPADYQAPGFKIQS